ncbi:GNAT family N-acetyltransferase [uncultured Cedecea sp.]|uniref:GNAT family N-acetyltransferase n=1 Tax=uncultured Cedecea sp. TaxID=988762 RepID=UPI002623D123|nr:GNAT family N-acetyltransferase [uncultured Cedecea sp.]
MKTTHYDTATELARCFTLMRELRGELNSEVQFIAQVQRQQAQGYRLAGLERDGKPVVLAGYRLLENFIHGQFCYVDDLVTTHDVRGQGIGAEILENLAVIAREYGCCKMVLDTAITNTQAQAFYQRVGYTALGLHFHRDLT